MKIDDITTPSLRMSHTFFFLLMTDGHFINVNGETNYESDYEQYVRVKLFKS